MHAHNFACLHAYSTARYRFSRREIACYTKFGKKSELHENKSLSFQSPTTHPTLLETRAYRITAFHLNRPGLCRSSPPRQATAAAAVTAAEAEIMGEGVGVSRWWTFPTRLLYRHGGEWMMWWWVDVQRERCGSRLMSMQVEVWESLRGSWLLREEEVWKCVCVLAFVCMCMCVCICVYVCGHLWGGRDHSGRRRCESVFVYLCFSVCVCVCVCVCVWEAQRAVRPKKISQKNTHTTVPLWVVSAVARGWRCPGGGEHIIMNRHSVRQHTYNKHHTHT